MHAISPPKALCHNIQSGSILSVGSPVLKKCSPVTSCRLGSIPTLWQTSLIRLAVMLRISLWQTEGNPPLGQLRACSVVKCWPQTQWEGRCDGRHRYLKHRASLKAPLCRANPCSVMGNAESQLEAPLTEHIVRSFCSLVGRVSFRSFAVLTSSCLWNLRALFLLLV